MKIGCKNMNQFKEKLNTRKNDTRSFYKTYREGKDGKKIYTGSIAPQLELNSNCVIGTVSCFVLNEKGEILVEERTRNKKIDPGTLDIVSGHIDNNEIPIQAMIREYVEELHNGSKEEQEEARNEAIENLKKLEELYLVCNGRAYYIQFYMMLTNIKTFTLEKEEVKSVRWVPMEELFEMIRQGKTGIIYDERLEKEFQQVKKFYQEIVKGNEEKNGTIGCFR